MAIDVVIEFVAKSTIKVTAYVYDKDGTLVNPTTSIKVTITDPTGTKVADAKDMSEFATGIFEYYLRTDDDFERGWYQGEVWVIDGEGDEAKTSFGDFGFRLK